MRGAQDGLTGVTGVTGAEEGLAGVRDLLLKDMDGGGMEPWESKEGSLDGARVGVATGRMAPAPASFFSRFRG